VLIICLALKETEFWFLVIAQMVYLTSNCYFNSVIVLNR